MSDKDPRTMTDPHLTDEKKRFDEKHKSGALSHPDRLPPLERAGMGTDL